MEIHKFYFTGDEYFRRATTEHTPYRDGQWLNAHENNLRRNEFCGGTFEQAVQLWKYGWAEGLEQVAGIKSRIEHLVPNKYLKLERYYAPFGGNPDVGVFLSGDPENMIHRHSVETTAFSGQSKIIKFVVNISTSSGMDNTTITMARGSIVCAVADVLEAIGYRCEIILSTGQNSEYTRYGVRSCIVEEYVTIKEANQPLDLERLAYALCHGTMYRRIAFANMENHGLDKSNARGRPVAVSDRGDIYLAEASYSTYGGDINAWAKKAIEIIYECGIEIE